MDETSEVGGTSEVGETSEVTSESGYEILISKHTSGRVEDGCSRT